MKIGFIGFGEAAFNLATGLHSEGITDIVAYDSMANDIKIGNSIHNRAIEASIKLVSSIKELAKSANVIIVAVPSVYALDVCIEAKKYLTNKHIYADVSASTPATKSKIWEEIEKTKALFVDAAMMGSLPKDKHKVPITASGNGAKKFKELLTPYNMKITVVGEEVGSASAIKLIRSIFMKGISTLMIEMLQAADSYDVIEEVVESISQSMDNISFNSHLDRLVTGAAIHCERRADELEGSIELLKDANLDSSMTNSSKKRLRNLEKYEFAQKYIEKRPSGWLEIIEVLRM